MDGSAFINPITFCTVEVEIADTERQEMIVQPVRLGYYRNKINKAVQDRLQAFFDSPNDEDEEFYKDILYPTFLQVVGWWDVKRGEEMWPLKLEDIQPMALQYISPLLFGAIRHSRTGKTAGEARGEGSAETKKLTPSSATSEATDGKTISPAASSPTNSVISISQKASPVSRPGAGKPRRSATMNARRSGSQRSIG